MALQKSIFFKVLLGIILLFLFLPLIQSTLNIKKYIRPLKGAFIPAEEVELNKTSWFNANYQNSKNEFLNQNFGFRNYFVMLNNQVDYSLFNKANVDKVVVGKGGFLYEDNYVEAYYGNNFVGKTKIEERINKLKDLQELLQTKGIFLEIVFAPGKATFYPEFIPEEWVSEKKLNNYEYTAQYCKEKKVNCVDINAWFQNIKNITPYDLYPKTGIHWSNYGSLLVFDSLTKRLEHRSGLNLKNFNITNVSFSDSLISPDDDIGSAMNLIKKIPVLPMPYAKYSWTEDTTFKTPNALFIGDSYFWNIYYEGLTNNLFKDCKFWYYNQTVYPESEAEREVKKLNLVEEINKQKIIVIMATDCNIHDLGWGFIEQAYDALSDEMKSIKRKNIYVKDLIDEIQKTPTWKKDVERKAKEKGISFEEMAGLDALYIYNTDYNKPDVIELTEENKKRILNTPEWISQIKKKAVEKNISFEDMLELDAKYIYITEQRKK